MTLDSTMKVKRGAETAAVHSGTFPSSTRSVRCTASRTPTSLQPFLILLQPHWPADPSVEVPGKLLPQDLGNTLCLCMERSFPRSLNTQYKRAPPTPELPICFALPDCPTGHLSAPCNMGLHGHLFSVCPSKLSSERT